jgi:hypothetical protein
MMPWEVQSGVDLVRQWLLLAVPFMVLMLLWLLPKRYR